MHPSPRLARRRATTLMATALAVLPAAGAHAADSERDVSAGAEIDLQSRAIARGVVASEGPAVQPSGWLGVRGATASVWSSFDPQGHECPHTGCGDPCGAVREHRTRGIERGDLFGVQRSTEA